MGSKKKPKTAHMQIDLDLDAIESAQATAKALAANYGALDSIKAVASQQMYLREVSESITRQMREAVQPILLIQENLQAYARSITAPLIQFQEQTRAILEAASISANALNSWMDHHRSAFASIAEKFKEIQEQYNLAEQEVLPCLRKYKWFISPSMPAPFIFEVYEIAKEPGDHRKVVNKLFQELVLGDEGETLDELLDDWKGKFNQARLRIIKDCFEVIKSELKNKKGTTNVANVVVPTLIVQIDGVILDFLKANNLSTGKYAQRKSDFKGNKSGALPPNYDSLVNDVLLEILFQQAETGKPLKNPFQFNRHKIIHGENKAYGRKDYLVRLILILDYLAHIESPKPKKK